MVNARTYFARMNNNRTYDSWLTEHHLLKGAEEFFRLNEYSISSMTKSLIKDLIVSLQQYLLIKKQKN